METCAKPSDRLARLVDLAAGLSLISWAVLGLAMADAPVRWTVVRVCISALNLTAGLLLLLRRTPAQFVRTSDLVAALPSFVLGGLIVRLSTEPPQAPTQAGKILFAMGAIVALSSLMFLGRSFAIFPVAMRLIERGPYRLLRHPAYAGELLMIAGLLIGQPWWLFVLAGLTAPAVMLRIVVEERLLRDGSDGYEQYAERVRWRLLPGIW
ncbi:MAG: isoprenylcysteine carboxylmethyltransferase family protein [Planctomycetia bacterium]|nr:isoprenylcysteine carboxylmethyltransferase family protein [Planctomycetia bacterium]